MNNISNEDSTNDDRDCTSYMRTQKIEINKKFAMLTLILLGIISFLAGRIFAVNHLSHVTPSDDNVSVAHPTISLSAGKEAPLYKYSGLEFDTVNTSRRTINSHLPSDQRSSQHICSVEVNGDKRCVIDNTNDDRNIFDTSDNQIDEKYLNSNENYTNEDLGGNFDERDDDEHLPAGQHLLMDFKNVDKQFLNSDARLAQAMVGVVNLSQLTLLSYHCHNLIPSGVSCVGVLLESHISLHTWPEAGVITFDLFTCGAGKLVPLVPIVESLFAIPQVGSSLTPMMKWVHKLRGFRPEDDEDILSKDIGSMLGDTFDLKKEVTSVQTAFQRIDVYDFQRSVLHFYNPEELSYMSTNPRLFQPERIVFLDGVIQSTRDNLEAYHEALVHPVMFTHKEPKRVAIIGGGEGATLMEVLKHNTVEKVQMIEIDEEMVKTSRQFLPEWSDCSDIIGSEKWCGDDDRAEMYYEDALAWFIDRYSYGGKLKHENHPKLDVIIMDALDPQDDIPFAEILYTDTNFLASLYNSLNDNGMIVFQLGESPDHSDPPDTLNKNRRRASLMKTLEDVGFISFHIYEDGHCGFEYPWTFLIVMKDTEDDTSWYRNEAETQIAIHKRVKRSKSGNPLLKYFDGATMKAYQIPHRVFQTIFCRQTPTPEGCILEEQTLNDVSNSDLEVKESGIGSGSGRGVFSKVDISKGMVIGRETASHLVYFPPSATKIISDRFVTIPSLAAVYDYMDGYGWQVNTMGGSSYYVESTLLTFINHGCNGTYNIGESLLKIDQVVTEQNAQPSDESTYGTETYNRETYNPYRLRHIHHISSTYEVALRDIKAGEELLTDYLVLQEGDEWWYEVEELKRMCNGEVVGFITQKEVENISSNED